LDLVITGIGSNLFTQGEISTDLGEELTFCHNSNFEIPKYLQPDGAYIYYFKLRLFNLPEVIVFNVKSIQHLDRKITG